MAVISRIQRIVGFAAIAIGLLWAGQGAGLIDWPASGFMINQRQWIAVGAGLALLGLVAVLRAGRRR